MNVKILNLHFAGKSDLTRKIRIRLEIDTTSREEVSGNSG
jgi:hypothetical protein